MEALAWIETLGHRGQVLNRQPIYAWPMVVANDYQGHMVVDDSTFCPVTVNLQANDGVRSVSVALANPTSKPTRIRINGAERLLESDMPLMVDGDDVVVIGATRLRIRLRGHQVSVAKGQHAGQSDVKWSTALALLGLTFLVESALYIFSTLDESIADQFKAPLLLAFIVVGWIGLWTASSKVVTGAAHAKEHFFYAGVLFCVVSVIDHLGSLLMFSLGWFGLSAILSASQWIVVGWLLASHMNFVRFERRVSNLAVSVTLVTLAWLTLGNGIAMFDSNERKEMDYREDIWPSFLVVSPGDAPDALWTDLDQLKKDVDQSAAELEEASR